MNVNANTPPDKPSTPRRRYYSPKRQRQADATRRSALVAAERLFASRGYAATTMEAIAAEAGISLATLYLHFPGRVAIVGALADEVAAAPDLSVERVAQYPTPIEQLRAGAHTICQLNERSWVITDILRSQRGSDPEVARLWALWLQRHLDAMRRAVAALAQAGALRPGLSQDDAADRLYALAGTEVYRALVQERGWSPARYERWLFDVACRELLADRSAADGP